MVIGLSHILDTIHTLRPNKNLDVYCITSKRIDQFKAFHNLLNYNFNISKLMRFTTSRSFHNTFPMFFFLVLLKWTLLSCLVTAKITRIFQAHMQRLMMFDECSFSSCLVITFPALVLIPVMDWFLVCDETRLLCCLVFTLPALKPPPFVNWFVVCG